MDRSLNSLDPRFKPLAMELLARFTEAGVMVCVVNTRRTAAEQADAIRRGVSWVDRSKHQDGLAIDVALYDTYLAHGADKLQWDTSDPLWLKLGVIGEALGLRWGGRFSPINDQGIGKDPGHFEYRVPTPATSIPTTA